jgi:hypothetical protein
MKRSSFNNPPPSEVIGVAALAHLDLVIEIVAIAALPDSVSLRGRGVVRNFLTAGEIPRLRGAGKLNNPPLNGFVGLAGTTSQRAGRPGSEFRTGVLRSWPLLIFRSAASLG